MDRARFVWIAGMTRAGSMWLLNVTRDLIRSSGAVVQPESVPQYENHHEFDPLIAEATAGGHPPAWWVFKIHSHLPESYPADLVIAPRRDIRDAFCSFMRFVGTDESEAIPRCQIMCDQTDHYWAMPEGKCLRLEYQDIVERPFEVASGIARRLTLDLDDGIIRQVVERYARTRVAELIEATERQVRDRINEEGRPADQDDLVIDGGKTRVFDRGTGFQSGHVSESRSGDWRSKLSVTTSRQINATFASWLVRHGYEVSLADTTAIRELTPGEDALPELAPDPSPPSTGSRWHDLDDGTRIAAPDDPTLMTPYVLDERGTWFEKELGILDRLVRDGDTVLDIGANYGLYTTRLARLVGPAGRVWAFEPVSATAAQLARTVAANELGNVTVLPLALGDLSCRVDMATRDNSELNTLLASADDAVEPVRVARLEECRERLGWTRVGFIKLDAEGVEPFILRDAAGLLAEFRPHILYEIKHGDRNNLNLLCILDALGYASFRHVPGLDLLAPVAVADPIDPYELNLVACHRERLQELEAEGVLFRLPERNLNISYAARHVWSHPANTLAPWRAIGAAREAAVDPGLATCLNLYFFAHDRAIPPAERYFALLHARKLASDLHRAHPTPLRLSTLARLALELGFRAEGVHWTNELAGQVDGHSPSGVDEPFLPCEPRFDGIDPGNRFTAWMRACALEALEINQSFSSYFCPLESHRLIGDYLALGFAGDAMRRRHAAAERLLAARAR